MAENDTQSPLELDKALVADLKIPASSELSDDEKKAFIQAQIFEIMKMAWRERVDIILSNKLAETGDEAVANQAKNKVNEHRMTLRQFLGSLDTLTTLLDEMNAEASSNPTE